MAANGFEVVAPDENADIYVINSCTVTAESDRKTRQAVRKFKRNHPESIVILTGCMPQAFPQDAEKLEQADIVLGNRNNFKLLDLIKQYFGCGQRIIDIEEHKNTSRATNSREEQFRALTAAPGQSSKSRTAVTGSAPIALSLIQGAESVQNRLTNCRRSLNVSATQAMPRSFLSE